MSGPQGKIGEGCPGCGTRSGIHTSDCPVFLGRLQAPNPYKRTVPSTEIDVYDVLDVFGVTDHAVAHAIKKLLANGSGEKGRHENIVEARQCLDRYMEMWEARR